MKRKLTIALFILLSWYASRAQTVTRLDEILQLIDTANPAAKMYEADIRSLNEAAKGARSWMPTEFATGLWMAPYNPRLWQKGQNGTAGMGQYMLSVQQMLPNAKKQDAEATYLQWMSAPQKERKNNAINELHAEAKKQYYGWIILKKKLSTLDENAKILDFMIKDAEIRYRNGLDKLNAYYKAKAELGDIMQSRLALQNEIDQKRFRLNTLMNRNKGQIFDIDTIYIIKDYAAAASVTGSLNSKSDIRALDSEIQLSGLQQEAERTKALPEFGIRYEHMFGFGGLPMQYTLMGMVKVPIGRGKRAFKANVESLRWKSEELYQQKQMLLNEAAGEVAGIIGDIATKKQQVKLFEDNILPALHKNFEVIKPSYQQNTEQLFTLLDAWNTLNKTQTEYLNQVQQLLNLQVELERILEIK